VLTTRFPEANDVLRVYSGQYQLAEQIDPVNNVFEEQAWDELKISTVYLLSPSGAKPGSEPDGTWQPFVQHGLFWNLNWIPARLFNAIDVADTPNALSGLGALGAGLLLPIVNTLGAATNDLAQMELNQITARSQAGTWWTPTGGGHTYAEAPIAPPAVGGLSKAARVAAAGRARAESANRAQEARRRLDPPFPFRAIGFNPERFHIS
jgi:hypothetical protein